MGENYRSFFGLQREPFCADISLKEVLVTPAINAVHERIDYAIRLGAVALVTGEIGSGKSTALRYVIGNLHPAEYRILYCHGRSARDPPGAIDEGPMHGGMRGESLM